MRLLHGTPVVRAAFDDPNLVSCAGLEPVMRLAESCDLHGIVREKVHVPGDKGSVPASVDNEYRYTHAIWFAAAPFVRRETTSSPRIRAPIRWIPRSTSTSSTRL